MGDGEEGPGGGEGHKPAPPAVTNPLSVQGGGKGLPEEMERGEGRRDSEEGKLEEEGGERTEQGLGG